MTIFVNKIGDLERVFSLGYTVPSNYVIVKDITTLTDELVFPTPPGQNLLVSGDVRTTGFTVGNHMYSDRRKFFFNPSHYDLLYMLLKLQIIWLTDNN
jgi:hypothetical protein